MAAAQEVLVISSRAQCCKPLVLALDQMGLKVSLAFTVEEASLALSHQIPVACCHADLFPEVLQVIHERGLDTRLLLISATGDCNSYLEAMEHGAFDCLSVPIDAHETQRIVQNALQSDAAPHRSCAVGA